MFWKIFIGILSSVMLNNKLFLTLNNSNDKKLIKRNRISNLLLRNNHCYCLQIKSIKIKKLVYLVFSSFLWNYWWYYNFSVMFITLIFWLYVIIMFAALYFFAFFAAFWLKNAMYLCIRYIIVTICCFFV